MVFNKAIKAHQDRVGTSVLSSILHYTVPIPLKKESPANRAPFENLSFWMDNLQKALNTILKSPASQKEKLTYLEKALAIFIIRSNNSITSIRSNDLTNIIKNYRTKYPQTTAKLSNLEVGRMALNANPELKQTARNINDIIKIYNLIANLKDIIQTTNQGNKLNEY